MAAVGMTYTSLVDDVQIYAERSDDPFVEKIPTFIMYAENRLATEVRGLGFQDYVTTSNASSTFAKPAQWRETISINITVAGERVFLQPRDYDYCRNYWPDPSETGQPKFYADYGYENYLIVPTPSAAFTFEVAYYLRPAPLSAENETNWTTQYAPQLLFAAVMLEAQPFLKRPDLMQVWQGMYDRALQGLGTATTRQFTDRIQQPRSSV